MSFALSAHPFEAVPELAAAAGSDPGSSRLVYATVLGLVLVGVAFVVLAVWVIRQTRVDPDLLAPLERMGDGDWRRKDPATQRRLLDEVRPDGAEPLHPEPAPPGVDDEFEHAERSVRSLDDLEPLRPEGVHATPATGAPLPDTSDPIDAEPPNGGEGLPEVSDTVTVVDGSDANDGDPADGDLGGDDSPGDDKAVAGDSAAVDDDAGSSADAGSDDDGSDVDGLAAIGGSDAEHDAGAADPDRR